MTPKVRGEEAVSTKKALGQFMSSERVATHLTTLLNLSHRGGLRVLDPGAGTGRLSIAVATRWATKAHPRAVLNVTCVEVDSVLADTLAASWERMPDSCELTLARADFIEEGIRLRESRVQFDAVIMNPPYARLKSTALQSALLRRAGLPATNLYAAFLAIGIGLLAPGGTLVAIVPRSFCNGAHFKNLRRLIVSNCAVEEVQVLESRKDAFKEDGVLQENVIVKLRRQGKQGPVRISFVADANFRDVRTSRIEFQQFVREDDTSLVFRLVDDSLSPFPEEGHSLESLGFRVVTGSVVDFRVRSSLRVRSSAHTVPLIHARHVTESGLKWPSSQPGRMNSITVGARTQKNVYPAGHYVVVRRFSPKEQNRRVIACHVDATGGEFVNGVAFENHVNVIAGDRVALTAESARLIVDHLTGDASDALLRALLGSTQVNASDLRLIPMPKTIDALYSLPTQLANEAIDFRRIERG